MPSRTLFYHITWLKRLHFKRLRGLWGIYLHSMFRTMGMSLVGIFIPIYIYQLTGEFIPIFIFYLFYHLTVVFTSSLVGMSMKHFGVDKIAILGAVLRAVFLFLLILSKSQLGLLWPSAIIWGLAVSSTWLPYHYTVVVEDDGDGKFGHEVSALRVVDKLAAGAAPFIGGVVIYFFGFSVLYLVGIILVAISAIPLLIDSFDKRQMRYQIGRVWQELFDKRLRPVAIGLSGSVLEGQIFAIFRPLFIFLALANVTKLGAIESIALLCGIAITWWAGNWVDKKGFGLMKIGIAANFFAFLLLPFLSLSWEFFLFTTIYVLIAALIWTPFDAAMYQFASQRRKLEFFVQREIIIHGASAVFFSLVWIVFGNNLNWLVIFGLGSFSLLLSLAILKGVKSAPLDKRLEIHPTIAR